MQETKIKALNLIIQFKDNELNIQYSELGLINGQCLGICVPQFFITSHLVFLKFPSNKLRPILCTNRPILECPFQPEIEMQIPKTTSVTYFNSRPLKIQINCLLSASLQGKQEISAQHHGKALWRRQQRRQFETSPHRFHKNLSTFWGIFTHILIFMRKHRCRIISSRH